MTEPVAPGSSRLAWSNMSIEGDEPVFYVNARALIERERNGAAEIVIQTRKKPGEPERIELPGGRLEPFEPILDALRREVREETGLTVTATADEDDRIDTSETSPEFAVECVKPFCAYQTIRGPFDSVGMYFRCRAEGELLESGDGAAGARWAEVSELERMMETNPGQFSDVDRAGLLYYFRHR